MRFIILLLIINTMIWAKIGVISAMKGDATIDRDAQMLSAKIGMDINEKDTITTKSKSKAQVILKDQTVITVGPKSEFFFESYDNESNPHAKMEAKFGFFKAITGKIGKIAPERFSIKTRSANIGIRGTHFMGYIADKSEKIGCLKGEIVVETDQGIFNVLPGQMLAFEDGKWSVKPLVVEEFSGEVKTTDSGDSFMQDSTGSGSGGSSVGEQTIQDRSSEGEATTNNHQGGTPP